MSDLISRDAAIAAIETARQAFALPDDVPGSRLVNAGFAAARGAVEKAPPASEWISVKERLPRIGQEVMIWHCAEHEPLSDGSIELATYKPGEDFGEKYAWSGSEYTLPMEDVTHWMDAPAPPIE